MFTADKETNPVFDLVAGLADDSSIETITFTPTLVQTAATKLRHGGASSLDGLLCTCLQIYQTV